MRSSAWLLGFSAAAIVLSFCGTAVLAQGGVPPSSLPEIDALRGPQLQQAAGRPLTLVHFDASGKLQRLDARPEQVALDVLKLSPEDRKGADAVLAARAVAVNKALQEHYDLFLKLQAARQGNAKPEEIRPIMREFRPAVLPLLEPALADTVGAAVPEEKRAEFRKLVDDYKRAVAAAEGPNERGGGAGNGSGGGRGRGRGVAGREDGGAGEMKPSDSPKAGTPKQSPETGELTGVAPIPPRVEMNLVVREIARALKGIVDERKERMDAFLKSVGATPEQEAQIRAIARETAERNKKAGGNGGVGELTQEEKFANWRRILDVLTPEQRRRAMDAQRN